MGEDVSILAVTKGFGPDAVVAAAAAGLPAIGENYQTGGILQILVEIDFNPCNRHFPGHSHSREAILQAGRHRSGVGIFGRQ